MKAIFELFMSFDKWVDYNGGKITKDNEEMLRWFYHQRWFLVFAYLMIIVMVGMMIYAGYMLYMRIWG